MLCQLDKIPQMTNCMLYSILKPMSQNTGFCYLETCKASAIETPGYTNANLHAFKVHRSLSMGAGEIKSTFFFMLHGHRSIDSWW